MPGCSQKFLFPDKSRSVFMFSTPCTDSNSEENAGLLANNCICGQYSGFSWVLEQEVKVVSFRPVGCSSLRHRCFTIWFETPAGGWLQCKVLGWSKDHFVGPLFGREWGTFRQSSSCAELYWRLRKLRLADYSCSVLQYKFLLRPVTDYKARFTNGATGQIFH